MQIIFRSVIVILILIAVIHLGQPVESNNPSNKELKKLADKWLTVKSWTASYNETYTSEKTWEMRPGVVMKTSVKNIYSGSFTLDSLDSDGQFYGEWYGFGSGSSTMDQIVTMTSSIEGGEIVITEHTHSEASGTIGDPSRNEYGEFWGGSLMIDAYSGTYSVGLGGPEDEGTATLTRTVTGLPTDYSSLEDLPEGMREIFLPMGQVAEKWATYEGPLEDARGIMVGGLAGFELFPDMDEPKEYPLPKSGMQLKDSYSGKNGIKSWSLSPGEKAIPLVLEKADKDWIPNPEEQKPVTIKVTGDGFNGVKGKIRFTLYEVTNEKGFCLNSGESEDFDLEFQINSSGTQFKAP